MATDAQRPEDTVLEEPHLNEEELEWCVKKIMPIIREYGTLGAEQALAEATRRFMEEL